MKRYLALSWLIFVKSMANFSLATALSFFLFKKTLITVHSHLQNLIFYLVIF
jgi:hypothetical protein